MNSTLVREVSESQVDLTHSEVKFIIQLLQRESRTFREIRRHLFLEGSESLASVTREQLAGLIKLGRVCCDNDRYVWVE